VVRDITFPVVFQAQYGASFGNCRDDCSREHHGVDIFSYDWKGAPIVAAHDGIVEKAEVFGTKAFCSVYIRGFDGWQTRYVHLNTDTVGTDDAEWPEGCMAPGIEVGAFVERGQLIGWMGDSGNAETTPAHLHFEIRTPRGLPVDPLRSLRRADRIRFSTMDASDPVSTSVALSQVIFPQGSPVVYVSAMGPAVEGFGIPWDRALPGPVLAVAGGTLDATVRDEIERLRPTSIVVLDGEEAVSDAVVRELRELAMTVERMAMPAVPAGRIAPLVDAIRTFEVGETTMQVVLVQTDEDLDIETEVAIADLAGQVPTLRFIQDDRVARSRGRSSYALPGRSGRRNSLYYRSGESWLRFGLADAPKPIPDLGVFLVAGNREVTAPTLTFLLSLAAAPDMPLWR